MSDCMIEINSDLVCMHCTKDGKTHIEIHLANEQITMNLLKEMLQSMRRDEPFEIVIYNMYKTNKNK